MSAKIKVITLTLLLIVLSIGSYIIYELYFTHNGRYTTPAVTEGLTRTVNDNTLVSNQYPAASITFPDDYTYLGGHKFILFGVADTEQYMFASAHEDGSTKSLIVVQFESLLPEINGAYDYSAAPQSIDIGGLQFWVDQHSTTRHWLFPNGKPGTDGYLHRTFMDDRGFSLPKHYIWNRLAYVPIENNREEMLIIYMEDLSKSGLNEEDYTDGNNNAKWQEFARGKIEWFKTKFKISR